MGMELNTDATLLQALRAASKRKTTHDETLAQRVSFVFGSMNPKSDVTRERIRQVLVDQEGGEVTKGIR